MWKDPGNDWAIVEMMSELAVWKRIVSFRSKDCGRRTWVWKDDRVDKHGRMDRPGVEGTSVCAS